ncbi:MAG: hypothetical protein WC852_03710 [Candidatus Nanoarchaeia archaeon]|jgi:hypothetical protein
MDNDEISDKFRDKYAPEIAKLGYCLLAGIVNTGLRMPDEYFKHCILASITPFDSSPDPTQSGLWQKINEALPKEENGLRVFVVYADKVKNPWE